MRSWINVKKIENKKTHYGLENGSLGFTDILHKQWWNLQHCLCPLAYTWAELHFQIYYKGPNDAKEMKYNLHYEPLHWYINL